MSALVRYQLALLLGAQRWLPPLILYAVLVGAGSVGGQPLGEALGWSAGVLVPAVGWLTRVAAGAEPPAARACVAAASGPRRAQLAALVAALLGGLVMLVAGTAYEMWISAWPSDGARAVVAQGIGAELVCVLVGTALGALCAPPVIRRVAAGVLTLGIVAIGSLVTGVSPAGAAIRGSMAQRPAGFPVLPLLAALVLVAATWWLSTVAAARRTTG